MTALQTTRNFHQYIGGVLNEVMPRPGISHAVVIVGWDDAKQAWLIKNSWGTTRWGPYGGYAWVHYKAHNIGTATVWVEPSKEYKLKDSCEPFDAVSARVRRISVPVGPEQEKDVWAIVDGETVVRTFGDAAPQSQNADDLTEDPNEDDARTALTMMRHYKIDRECNVSQSSDDAPFRYWLVGNKAPSGRHPDEDCVDIEWQRLDVTKEGDDWLLSDGTSLLEVFPGDRFNKTEEAAWLAYGYLKKHKMTRMCYFSRRDTTLRYYRQ